MGIFKMNEEEVLRRAILHFGPKGQISKTIEEMGELLADLGRHQNNNSMMLNIIEEIADCFIMLKQLKLIFGEDLVETKIKEKLKRLELIISSGPQRPVVSDYFDHIPSDKL
jgi:NTP pyrophosphatase (non-canonical NTP hydrolase)